MIRSSGPVSYDFASLDNSVMMDTETICSVGSNTDDSGPPSLQNEIDNIHTAEKAAETDSLQQQNRATSPQNTDTSPIVPNIPSNGMCIVITWLPLLLSHHITCSNVI